VNDLLKLAKRLRTNIEYLLFKVATGNDCTSLQILQDLQDKGYCFVMPYKAPSVDDFDLKYSRQSVPQVSPDIVIATLYPPINSSVSICSHPSKSWQDRRLII
jgi:hypothetical protein